MQMALRGPTMIRRQVGARLREARRAAGKTVADVVATKIVSKSTLRRFENGKHAVTPGTVLELCRLYGMDRAGEDALYELAHGTLGRGWWEDAEKILASGFGFFIGLEATASQILTFEADVVPGLLQTADYARAIERASLSAADDDSVQRRAEIRMTRQRAVFERNPPVRLCAVLGAGALARQVGGPDVLRAQIAHLRTVAEDEQADLRVLPWETGAHAATAGPFVLMRYENPDDPTVVYAPTTVGSSYFELPRQVERYGRAFQDVYHQSIPIKEYRA
jgi:transcriptional regulator with XRE-family HTH domain